MDRPKSTNNWRNNLSSKRAKGSLQFHLGLRSEVHTVEEREAVARWEAKRLIENAAAAEESRTWNSWNFWLIAESQAVPQVSGVACLRKRWPQRRSTIWRSSRNRWRDDKKPVMDKWQLAVLRAICRTLQAEEQVRATVVQQIVAKRVDI